MKDEHRKRLSRYLQTSSYSRLSGRNEELFSARRSAIPRRRLALVYGILALGFAGIGAFFVVF